MNQKKLSKTFMMIEKLKKHFGLHGLYRIIQRCKGYPDRLNYLNFQPIEAVSRYRDPQPQVVENLSYFFSFEHTYICKSGCLDAHFIPNNSNSID